MNAIRPMEIATVHPHKSELGEGPFWDAHKKAICWVDILNGHLHEYVVHADAYRRYEIGKMIGCAAVCKDQNFILASTGGIGFLNRDSGLITYVDHPEKDIQGNRFNDGACDPAGRFWVGSMALSEETGAGSVYMFENGISSKKIENSTISNGMAWNADHTLFYFIDTPTGSVVAYDFEVKTGMISNKRVVISIDEKEGFPDGMTIDSEGMLWIAHWGGWQVTRWNPQNGELLTRIKLPVAKITSCTFGGEDLKDLYVTSAKVDLTEEELKKQPLAGSLFVIRNGGYQGVPGFLYKN
ncbi:MULTISPECIES: SMP-30/gluconolactonase/LRE family protein [Maribacter]|uniref:Regucalcin n=1 Tax=Maribacter flavus TaxID=1658664 RepID=A0ABU7IDS6_9FLAO|nr:MULTISPECIES: SMP-30/gluconolactonase/LRE family protein [Maribacter]MDC6403944.1 SMP-30/gluconolactonase/LRE family protein [Maribacter sp. PR66]MEE1971085.1 SMP-30/gluconolactonase/LRE family protein [Maribacter flavus]